MKPSSRIILLEGFISGVVATAVLYFLLKDVEGRMGQLTVQNLVSSVVAGVVVGLVLPRVPHQAVAFFAVFSTIAGMTVYIILYALLACESLIPYLFSDFLFNLSASCIGGFVGGIFGSVVKRRIG